MTQLKTTSGQNPVSNEEDLKLLLTEHGLKAFIPTFLENGCTLSDLKLLRDDDIDDLCKELHLPVLKKTKLRRLIMEIRSKDTQKINNNTSFFDASFFFFF